MQCACTLNHMRESYNRLGVIANAIYTCTNSALSETLGPPGTCCMRLRKCLVFFLMQNIKHDDIPLYQAFFLKVMEETYDLSLAEAKYKHMYNADKWANSVKFPVRTIGYVSVLIISTSKKKLFIHIRVRGKALYNNRVNVIYCFSCNRSGSCFYLKVDNLLVLK